MLRRRAHNSGGAAGAGGEEKMLPIAPPFQSATRHPMALTTQDREDQMLRSATRNPLAMSPDDGKDQELYEGIAKQDAESPPLETPVTAAAVSPEEPRLYQSPTALRLARSPLEPPVILETHELEQPTPELEAYKEPSELDSQMIYPPRGELESPADTPGTRRTRAARDKLGSEHWTFLRESSATDGLE